MPGSDRRPAASCDPCSASSGPGTAWTARAARIRRTGCRWLAAALGAAALACASSPPPSSPPESAAPIFDASESGAVRVFLSLADAREDRGDLAGALEATERALAEQPGSRRAAIRRAELQARLGEARDDPARVADARAALDAIPDPETAEWLHADARIAMAEGRLEDARADLEAALERSPDTPRLRVSLAQVLHVQGERTLALAELEEELERFPGSTAARAERASLFLEEGMPSRAVTEAQLALRARSDDVDLWLVLARALRQRGRHIEALRALETIPEADRDAAAWAELGRLELRRDREEEAATALARAEELAPYDPAVLELRLDLAVRAEDPQPALDRIEEAVAASPDDAELLGLQSTALDAVERREEASDALREALELSPESPVLIGRLRRHVRQLELDEPEPAASRLAAIGAVSGPVHSMAAGLFPTDDPRALRYLERALELDPEEPLYQNDLAYRLLETGGDLDRALALARSAHQALPSNWAVADTLGAVLMARGETAEAVAVLEAGLDGAPEGDLGVAESHYRLARALAEAGDDEAALRELGRALRVADAVAERPVWREEARALRDRLER